MPVVTLVDGERVEVNLAIYHKVYLSDGTYTFVRNYNPNHDPGSGKFSTGKGGGKSRVGVVSDSMKRYLQKKNPITEKTKLYRGESDSGGTGTALYGQGLYMTTSKSYAAKYGKVREVPYYETPNKPAIFKTELDFKQFETEYAKNLGVKSKTLLTRKVGDTHIRMMKLGFDGVVVGPRSDAIVVAYDANAFERIQKKKNEIDELYLNYNPNHDPGSGEFSVGKGGGKMTATKAGAETAELSKMKQTGLAAQDRYNKKLIKIRTAYYKDASQAMLQEKSTKLMDNWYVDSYATKDKMETNAQLIKSKKGLLRFEYSLTQAFYKAKRKKSVTLYRGISGRQAKLLRNVKQSGGGETFAPDYASSWSDAKSVAMRFSFGNSGREPGVIIKREVPVKNIVTNWQVHQVLNTGGENEYIVRDGLPYFVHAKDIIDE